MMELASYYRNVLQLSFNTIKAALINSLILIFPDPSETYIAFTDAFKYSSLAVSTQECVTTMNSKDIKSFLPIMSISRIFVDSKEKLDIFDKGSLYNLHAKVIIKCDHAALHKFLTVHTLNSELKLQS